MLRSSSENPRRISRFDRAVRFVSALSMGGLGAARGCGGGTITSCSCPVDASLPPSDGAARTDLACSSIELDAGCTTILQGVPSGPLPPPELSA